MWLNAQKVEQITKPITNTTRGVGEGRAIRHATIRRPTNHTSPPSFLPPGPLAAAGLLGGRAVNAPQAWGVRPFRGWLIPRVPYILWLVWCSGPTMLWDMVLGGFLQWLPARVMSDLPRNLPRWHTQRCGRCQNSRYLHGMTHGPYLLVRLRVRSERHRAQSCAIALRSLTRS